MLNMENLEGIGSLTDVTTQNDRNNCDNLNLYLSF